MPPYDRKIVPPEFFPDLPRELVDTLSAAIPSDQISTQDGLHAVMAACGNLFRSHQQRNVLHGVQAQRELREVLERLQVPDAKDEAQRLNEVIEDYIIRRQQSTEGGQVDQSYIDELQAMRDDSKTQSLLAGASCRRLNITEQHAGRFRELMEQAVTSGIEVLISGEYLRSYIQTGEHRDAADRRMTATEQQNEAITGMAELLTASGYPADANRNAGHVVTMECQNIIKTLHYAQRNEGVLPPGFA